VTYDDGLTPDVLVTIIAAAIKERDFEGVKHALTVLAVRDPKMAAEVKTVLDAGIILGRLRHAAEGAE
jgi:hypothetical protein